MAPLHRRLWLPLLLLLAGVPVRLAGTVVEGELLSEAVVDAAVATVADVARLQAPPALAARLAELEVQALPDAAWRTVRRERVQAVVQAAVPEVELRLRGGDCRVRRGVHTITPADFAAVALADVRQRLQLDVDDPDIDLRVRRAAPAVELPVAGADAYRLLAEPLSSSDWGELPYRVRILQDGSERQRVLLVLYLERFRRVPVAARALPRGHIIDLGDVRTHRQLVAAQAQADAPDLSGVQGAQLRAAVAPGQVLSWGLLRRPPLVRGGRQVTIRYRGEGFSVHIVGTALGDGAAGEWVSVRPQGGGRVLRARVVGPALVSVVR